MLKYLKDISSGFFILVVAFSYNIYFVIATFLGIPQEGVVFRLYSGILAVVVAFVFFCPSIVFRDASTSVGCCCVQ